MSRIAFNQRAVERRKCLVEANIILPGRPAIHCHILDLTKSGARLRHFGETYIYNRIMLFIPSLPSVFAAQVRWRKDADVGVRFLFGEADLPIDGPHGPDDGFVLNLQLAQLRRRRAGAAR